MNRLTKVRQYTSVFEVPKELVMHYRYNRKGLLTEEINEKQQTTCYFYDEAGNLTEKTERDGTTIQFAYDAVNNITSIKYNENKKVNYQ